MFRDALADAHGSLERTVRGLDQTALDWVPPGTANPIGATFAHLVVSEDMVANAVLAGREPLLRTTFAGRTGLSEPMPTPGPDWADYGGWARRLRVDPALLLAYAQATWQSSEDFVGSLAPADLEREVDLRFLGRGLEPLGLAVLRMLCMHVDQIHGEIACLKGLQGRGGYG
jgi:hypothetical protein